MSDTHFHFDYVLRLGDNALILAQRLGEWCGHGPALEQDIALTNMSLDLLGQARLLLAHAGSLPGGKGMTDDELAFTRDAHQFRNALLVEQPNQDWAYTMARQFFFDVFNFFNYQALLQSSDSQLAAIAEKSLKEVTYHLRASTGWMLRLGDGTELSHTKLQTAVDDLWMFTGELITPNETDRQAAEQGLAPDLNYIAAQWHEKVDEVLAQATIKKPVSSWMQSGGKDGLHTEHLGFILAELQFLQRAYPNSNW